MKQDIESLRALEWSTGNGQCPECCGVPERWYGHPCFLDPQKIGHELDCSIAQAIKENGESPLMKGDFKSDKKFEHYISEDGFFGMREKTKNGCERIKAFEERLNKKIYALIADFVERIDHGAYMEFELHPGPLLKGDLIVIEINGKLVPKRPYDALPQWFVVLEDQEGSESVQLKPFNNQTKLHKARRYLAMW